MSGKERNSQKDLHISYAIKRWWGHYKNCSDICHCERNSDSNDLEHERKVRKQAKKILEEEGHEKRG